MKQVYFLYPALLSNLKTYLNQTHPQLKEILTYLFPYINHILSYISNLFIFLPKMIFFIFLTLFLTFFFILDIHQIGRITYKLSPFLYQQCCILQNIFFTTFKAMILSSLKLSGITGLLSFIGLAVIQIKHALSFSFIIACFDLLPFIGISSIFLPTCIYFSLMQDEKALYLWILYGILSFTRFLIEPKIMSKQLNLPILLHIFMMVICTKLFGAIGFLYAPILCVFLILWYKNWQAK